MYKDMRIGIDARKILNPQKNESIGVGHYTYQLIRHLLEIDDENEYVIFFDANVRQKDVRKFTRKNVKIVFYPFFDYKKYLPGVYNEILALAIISREKLDILHVTSTEVQIPATYKGKVVLTVHDLGVFKTPKSYRKIARMQAKTTKRLMIQKASHVIAVSHIIKDDIVNIYNIMSETIDVIYSGLDKRFFAEIKNYNGKNVPKKFGITKKYILFLGTIEPSKNITRLLHAFSLFKEARIKKNRRELCDYQLLIAGKPGWLAGDIKHMVRDLQLARDVKFSGYVIGDELIPIFKNAEFFVLPSLYEGFGTTILEAFATGTPAIITNAGSAPEIANNAAKLVNPIDTKEIAQAMIEFTNDEELRDEFRQRGLKRAEDFDWQKTAKKTLEIYKKVMSV